MRIEVHSPKHHFMHLGVLFEAMGGKRILIVAPGSVTIREHYNEMHSLVRDCAGGYSAEVGGGHGRIKLQNRGSIHFASEDESNSVRSARGAEVDYVVYLGEPTAEIEEQLWPLVVNKQGSVVFG